jgi:hypothetical protein
MIEPTRYSYGLIQKGKTYFFLMLFGAAVIYLFVISYSFIQAIFLDIYAQLSSRSTMDNSGDNFVAILSLWLFAACIGLFIALFSNFEPDIQISSAGLSVQVFIFWWVFVAWGEIEEVRPTKTSFSSRIVLVRRLTPVHRLIGWIYAGRLKPGFLIRRQLEGYDEVLSTIREQLGSN